MTLWEEIRAFAQNLTGLTDADLDTWAGQVLGDRACQCHGCKMFWLYTNILEAIEKWEARKK